MEIFEQMIKNQIVNIWWELKNNILKVNNYEYMEFC